MDIKLNDVKKRANKLLIIILSCVFIGVFFFGLSAGPFLSILLAITVCLMVYFVISEYLKARVVEYEKILRILDQISSGDFQEISKEPLDTFEPIRQKLEYLQVDFQNALEKKVKSERMKTELITNVSHDLKTPLTAITTYIELLKKEDITAEERQSYIETLENKSARMKVLIEDLFVLSKANSNDMLLELSKVDLVNLIKQVVIEHEETYKKKELELIWNIPEEKIEISLDNQKTYRIFENLFLNIEKYAMKNSRIYIDIIPQIMNGKSMVEITIRNMSEVQLHIPGEQLTERFVRGDLSRNTEGSGLGLAIAKSFVELQNGDFEVIVDGDLFKTVILFPN